MRTATNRTLVLTGMILAVSMMFIDQTIVALAVPDLSRHLALSSTGAQWCVNAYLLALSALFAFGGRLGDVLGHRRTVLVGVAGFAAASALCGATPAGPLAEPWLIASRVLQGASAALLYPAALSIVIASFDLGRRGRALALFFGVSSALTAVGPVLGGYLTEWTWRSIFWINVPIALIALVLIARTAPATERRRVPIDLRGAALISGGVGLAVLGLQQSAVWGWGDARTVVCIVAGVLALVAFAAGGLRTAHPLIDVRVFARRGFAADAAVLALMSAAFVPFFFFASVYAQEALGKSASSAGTLLLAFFGGCIATAQLGGRIFDARGARPTIVLGCVLSAAGFALWGHALTGLSLGSQWPFLVLAGAGMGFVIGPASTDALGRAGDAGFGAVTGITQTVRNLSASVGLAVLGSVFIAQTGNSHAPLDVAHSTQTIAWAMAALMASAGLVAALGLRLRKSTAPSIQ
jgi:EmrB/QacA subfamily drug resistance transporter